MTDDDGPGGGVHSVGTVHYQARVEARRRHLAGWGYLEEFRMVRR